MIPNPIRKVLSSIQEHRVRALLMGGQACVLYGAAEFSRDTDLAILANTANLKRLQSALHDLRAEVIAIPEFTLAHLKRGHAVPFRCQHPEAARLRVDVMSRMRGVEPFARLWKRRTTLTLPDGTVCHVLSLPDLVKAKKTQRDKDWPMIRRLIEAHYFQNRVKPGVAKTRFWLLGLRTPQLLIDVSKEWPRLARSLARQRPLLAHAIADNAAELENALHLEEQVEREKDRKYWEPLKRELESLRHARQ